MSGTGLGRFLVYGVEEHENTYNPRTCREHLNEWSSGSAIRLILGG